MANNLQQSQRVMVRRPVFPMSEIPCTPVPTNRAPGDFSVFEEMADALFLPGLLTLGVDLLGPPRQ